MCVVIRYRLLRLSEKMCIGWLICFVALSVMRIAVSSARMTHCRPGSLWAISRLGPYIPKPAVSPLTWSASLYGGM